MAEYLETSVAGTRYVRANSLHFLSPRGQPPRVVMRREVANVLGADVVFEPLDEITRVVTMEKLATSFPLRNPLTNALIPGQSATYQDLYVLLFSFGWHLNVEQDAPIPPVEPGP